MVKNTFKTLVILAIFWLWLPTGPSDLFIIPFIIERIGFQGYMIVSILLVVWLYKTVEGRTLKDKLNTIRREIKQFIG